MNPNHEIKEKHRKALIALFEELQVPDVVRKQWLEMLDDPSVRVQAKAKLLGFFAMTQQIRAKKQADYGLTWREYGLDGVFFNIATKFGRLKNLVWKKQAQHVQDESVWDTLLDLLNYVLYALFLLEEGNVRGVEDVEAAVPHS